MTTIHNLLKRDTDCGCSFIATPLIDKISEPWNEFSYSPLDFFKSFLLLIEIPLQILSIIGSCPISAR